MNVWTTLDPAAQALQMTRLANLFPRPVESMRPQAKEMNGVILAFPHSGREYPAQWLRSSRLGQKDLRRSEDAYVDELVMLGPEQGYSRVEARFPRAWVDVNRHPDLLDPKLCNGLATDEPVRNPQVLAGLGVVPRVVAEGMPIYRHKLSLSEIRARLELTWHPYHAQLARMLANTSEACGRTLLVDCHSMPGPCRRSAGPQQAEIVIGDGHGGTCDEAVSSAFETAFSAQGFRVVRNNPYAGGYTVRSYGQCKTAQQAVQIEICRNLYMDELDIEKKPGFEDVAHRLSLAINNAVRQVPGVVPE